MDRLSFVALFLVGLALLISGEIQDSPSPYILLRTAPKIILDAQFTVMNKMIVKVVPTGAIRNQDFIICLGYEYLTSSSASLIGLKKYFYSSLNGSMSLPQDIPVTINSFRDFAFLDKGDDSCSTGILEEISSNWKVGTADTFSNVAMERNPIRAAITKPDYSGTAILSFFCNTTACFDNTYNPVSQASGTSIYSSINVANIGQSSYLATMSFNPSTGVKQGQVSMFNNGVWSVSSTSNTAREISVTSWDDNDFMFCYDNGILQPIDSPTIYCRSKNSGGDIIIDEGRPNAANATFSQVNVSPVNPNYAFVSALATNGVGSHYRLYTVTKGSEAALDPRTLLIGTSAVRVASHSKGNIIAVAVCYAAAIDLNLYGFDMSVFNPPVAPPVATPITPPVTTAPQAAPNTNSPVAPPSSSPVGTPTATVVDPPVADSAGLTQGAQIGVGVAVSAVGAGAGLFVLLFLLKKKRDKKKKQKSDETPMDPVDGSKEPGSDNTYGNLPGMDNGKYSNINLTGNSKYGNVSVAGSDDGIAVPTSIQPSEIDKRMHIPYKSLVFVKEIGAGSYGKVYLGEWRGAKVAIKVNNTVTDVDGFLAEAKLTLGITPHPNLVQTFGVSLDGPNPCIVLEYCGGGSLDQLFSGDKGLTNEKRLEYALKIGYGLLHLHSRSIVHRDLAARNILLTNDGQPKISDFGMSRIVQEEAAKGRTKTNFGPIRWMAPECLKDKSYSLKSDVWSFGIILYELVAGKEPHEDADQLEIALKIRDKGETPKIPEDCDPVLCECMEMCWKFSPNDRPSMEDVCAFLRSKSPDS